MTTPPSAPKAAALPVTVPNILSAIRPLPGRLHALAAAFGVAVRSADPAAAPATALIAHAPGVTVGALARLLTRQELQRACAACGVATIGCTFDSELLARLLGAAHTTR